ncbi:Lar family restriction alleviation protein [Bombella apis]|uniref:Lar family restriction alleviation protein n=1 Tax=Bombella apis TaxID=1785988 RepID=UPI0031F68802
MSEKIKQCPFCGSNDVSCETGHHVSCHTCHAIGPDEPLPDADWVITRWNRRPFETGEIN